MHGYEWLLHLITCYIYADDLKLEAKPNRGDDLESHLRVLTALTLKEPGTLDYVISRDPQEPEVFYVYEKYTGRAAFEAHIAAPEFTAFVNANLLAAPPAPKALKPLKPL
jgi:quinol monooxygenase YgiN